MILKELEENYKEIMDEGFMNKNEQFKIENKSKPNIKKIN